MVGGEKESQPARKAAGLGHASRERSRRDSVRSQRAGHDEERRAARERRDLALALACHGRGKLCTGGRADGREVAARAGR